MYKQSFGSKGQVQFQNETQYYEMLDIWQKVMAHLLLFGNNEDQDASHINYQTAGFFQSFKFCSKFILMAKFAKTTEN